MMKLIREEDLLQAAAEKGVIARESSVPDPKKSLVIEGTIQDLIELASQRKSILLYKYTLPDQNIFLIDHETIESAWSNICSDSERAEYEDVISEHLLSAIYGKVHPEELDLEEMRDLKKDISKLDPVEKNILDDCLAYNSTVDSDEMNRPVGLIAFVPVDGFAVTVVTDTDDYKMQPALNAARNILARYKDELIAQHEEASRKAEEQLEKLRYTLLKDARFLICTNKSLRSRYTDDLFYKNQWVQDLFHKYYKNCLDFVETVWAEYRRDKTIVDKLDK